MSSRPLIIASLVGASIGVPYVASRTSTSLPETAAESTSAADSTEASSPPADSAPAPPATSASPAERPVQAVEQVLRFDLSQEWVYRTWDRKSIGPTDVGLIGVRVPLVTGTHPGALAGALTYYFNAHGQVEHISFRGRTGDPAPLTDFLVRTYEFKPVAASLGEQVYQVGNWRRVKSELRTRPESVLRSEAPQKNYAVELELARPGSRRSLPSRGPQLDLPAASSQANGATGAETEGDSFFDRFRYATPQEKAPMHWMRWPN